MANPNQNSPDSGCAGEQGRRTKKPTGAYENKGPLNIDPHIVGSPDSKAQDPKIVNPHVEAVKGADGKLRYPALL